MKRIIVVGSILLLILLSVSQISASPPYQGPGQPEGRDEPLPPIRTAGIIPEPDATDSVFVSNRGDLDQYLFRGQGSGPNGELTFYIPITRYYFNAASSPAFDANGFINTNDLQDLIDRQILPATAKLRLHVFDVDEDVPSPYCAEVDYVTVNDKLLGPNGSQVKLSGANETWSTVSFDIPIRVLKFPTAKGQNGQSPTPVDNEIKIDIDVECLTNWAVEVDWGVIEIPSPIRPIIFAHGWTGNTDTFDAFEGFAQTDSIPTAGQPDLLRGIQTIAKTAPNLLDDNKGFGINIATQEFGVDKVNIFAHSKGGLVSRYALRNSGVADKVEHLITFGSPHHGTNWITTFARLRCSESVFPNQADRDDCWVAAREQTVDAIRDNFNYQGCTKGFWPWSPWTGCQPRFVQQQSVDYRTIVGGIGDVRARTATYPWNADAVPFPENSNVDAQFGSTHLTIHTTQESYRCAISFIDPNIYAQNNCHGVTSTGVVVANVSSIPTWPSNEYQTTFETTGSLLASGNTTLFATVDTVEQVLFNVYTTDELTSFMLQDPGGGTITPATAGVAYYGAQQDGGEWWYQYSIDTPAAGIWQLNLNALNATDYSGNVTVKSNTKLFVKTDKYTYDHNELVTVEAALTNNTTPLLGSTINLVVTRPDNSTLNLSLVDNGSNGDVTANNGIYTTQFNSSTVTGHHQLALSTVNGQTTRLVETSIAVTPQTAQIQSAVSERPVDTNSNGLYDELTLNLSLNVLIAGHFEVAGTLVDSNGDPIASASYATLRDGSGPLSTGTQTIPLTFSGFAIRDHGVNGPYTLTNVFVEDQSSTSLQVDSAENVYTTAAYQVTQFEGSLLSLAGGGETSVDSNGNGLYDILN